jgi:hypothetical protein
MTEKDYLITIRLSPDLQTYDITTHYPGCGPGSTFGAFQEKLAQITLEMHEGLASATRLSQTRTEAQDASRSHSTVPTEKPRTEALSASQRISDVQQRLAARLAAGAELVAAEEQNTTLVPGSVPLPPQGVVGCVTRDPAGTWTYTHLEGKYPTQEEIDALLVQVEKNWAENTLVPGSEEEAE